MIFQKIRVGTSVIPLFGVILTGESITYIIFMIQVIVKVKGQIEG